MHAEYSSLAASHERKLPVQTGAEGMRDHTKLEAFHAADALVMTVYSAMRTFPREERFGLCMQLRRAVISAAASIVEGCGRQSAADYGRFLSMAYSSAREAQYEIDVSIRLGYVGTEKAEELREAALRATQLLNRLVASVESFKPR